MSSAAAPTAVSEEGPPGQAAGDATPPAPTGRRPPKAAQRGDIQGLRGIAVLTVCLSHAGMPFFDGGYVGVDVFFVISGFLITGILMREISARGTISLSDFYARRARRILPAAALVLIATVLASWLALGVVRLQQVLDDVVWAGLFAANVHFARIDDDYFADTAPSPVRHYWSLAAEEQFYLVWPLLLLLVVWLVRRRKGLTGPPALRYVVHTLVAVTLISLAWCIYQTETDPTFAYYAPMTRAWELGAGALLAVVEPRLRRLKWTTLNALSLLGLVAIAFATIAYSDATSFPGRAAIIPVFGACLVIAGGSTPAPRGASRALDRGPLRWAGDISYSLYLWHWPFLVLPQLAGHDMSLLDNVNMLLLAAALAVVTERWVERPFREGGFWRARRLRSLALWPAAAGTVLAATFVAQLELTRPAPVTSTLDTAPAPVPPPRAGQPAPTASDRVVAAVGKAAAQARADAPVPTRLAPPLLQLKDYNWYLPAECWAQDADTRHEICTFGDPEGDRTLVLLGDSHSGVWADPIADQAQARGWKVHVLLKPACPPYDVPIWRHVTKKRFTECEAYRRWSVQQVKRIAPDVLAVSGYTRLTLFDPATEGRMDGDTGARGTRVMEAGMRRTLGQLRGAAKQLVLIGDTNQLAQLSGDCLGARGARLGDCAQGRSASVTERTNLWAAATRQAGGRFVDVAPWLCQDGLCPLVVGNTVVYTDDNHLTRPYAAALGPALADALGM